MFSPFCPLLCKHSGVRSSWLLHQEVALGSSTSKPIFCVCWCNSWGLFHFFQDDHPVCGSGCDSSTAARPLQERARVAFCRHAVQPGQELSPPAACTSSKDWDSHAHLSELSWSGLALCFVPGTFLISDAVCAEQGMAQYLCWGCVWKFSKHPCAKKSLKKSFCYVFIKFLGANATFYGLYHNLKFLYAEGCQKRSGYACMHFHVHKNKHLQRVFKCVMERQQSSVGLVKGLLSWHNVAVLAKVLL